MLVLHALRFADFGGRIDFQRPFLNGKLARVTIRDFLWSDDTSLPVDRYSEDEVNVKAGGGVFRHVYRAYPTVPSPYYSETAQLRKVFLTRP